MIAILFFLFSCFCINYTAVKGEAAPIGSVPMRVVNHAGVSIELYWNDVFSVRPGDDMKLVLQTSKPIRNSSDTTINSYNTHEFVVRFVKHVESGPQVRFVKGPNEETITIHYDANTKQMSVTQRTKFDELMDKVKEATVSCDEFNDGDKFADCVSQLVIKDISKITDSKDIIASYRDTMSHRLRNYVCSDLAVNITQSSKNTTYAERVHNNSNAKAYEVQNMLDSSHAKIFVIDGFVTETECQALKSHHDAYATVTTTGLVSNATISLDDTNNAIKALHRRVTALYNHKTISGHTTATTSGSVGAVQSDGQEDVYTHHYPQKAELLPQCDYDCDEDGGRFVEDAARVATVVLHCQTPTLGGVMVFPKADVILRSRPYSAVIISYIGSDGRVDEGIAQRSECPVVEGEKFQALIHLRHGVSLNNPWHSYVAGKADEEDVVEAQVEEIKGAKGEEKAYRSQFAKYNDLHKDADTINSDTTTSIGGDDEL